MKGGTDWVWFDFLINPFSFLWWDWQKKKRTDGFPSKVGFFLRDGIGDVMYFLQNDETFPVNKTFWWNSDWKRMETSRFQSKMGPFSYEEIDDGIGC